MSPAIVFAACTAHVELDLPRPSDVETIPADLVTSGVQTCTPGAGIGFDRDEIGAAWVAHAMTLSEASLGVVVADLDGDTWHDLVIPRMVEPTEVWFGDGSGHFVAPTTPVLPPLTDVVGGSAADADGDGDLDLALYRYFGVAQLAVNDGTGHFGLQALESEADLPTGCGGSASWADYDLDGDLDLFLGRVVFRHPPATRDGEGEVEPCDKRLLENLGGLEFRDRPELLTADAHANRVFASGWVETDDDPWPELYLVADLPGQVSPGNRLLDNDGGVFTQPGTPLDFQIAGMGLGQGDLNEDGQFDYVVPGISEIKVMQSTDPGIWIDIADATGVIPSAEDDQLSAWSGELVDLDNDTDLDIVVTFGRVGAQGESQPDEQPDELWMQHDDGNFVRSGEAWGFADPTISRGTVTADLDRNGALDIVKRSWSHKVSVDLQPCRAESWLLVRLHDPTTANVNAIGALVTIQIGERVLSRLVEAGSTGFSGGGPPEAHFGLAGHDRVDGISVVWPGGEVSAFGALDARQVVDITRH